jgi:hypothetical protein
MSVVVKLAQTSTHPSPKVSTSKNWKVQFFGVSQVGVDVGLKVGIAVGLKVGVTVGEDVGATVG